MGVREMQNNFIFITLRLIPSIIIIWRKLNKNVDELSKTRILKFELGFA